MIRPTFVAPALIALAVGLATRTADAQRVSRLTGAKLLGACENPKGRLICEGYISGVGDGIAGAEKNMTAEQGHSFAGATCIPNDTTADQLHSTVVDYLKAHRDVLSQPAAIPTFDALHAAYPCKPQ